jgi:hypothetical protein
VIPDEKILDRLVKLIEMSKRGTEHEAEIAAQRAAELMAKHQIDAATVEAQLSGKAKKPDLERGRVDADNEAAPSRVERWHSVLLAAVAEACGGRAWMHGKGRKQMFFMVGPKGAVDSAKYLYAMLEKDVNRLSREAGRRHEQPSNAWRRAYALGMSSKISHRLMEGRKAAMSQATSTALVVVDATKRAIDDVLDAMDLRQQKRGAQKRPDAMTWGYIDGDKVDLGITDRARLGEGQKKLRG